jgi:hypothetical protein
MSGYFANSEKKNIVFVVNLSNLPVLAGRTLHEFGPSSQRHVFPNLDLSEHDTLRQRTMLYQRLGL